MAERILEIAKEFWMVLGEMSPYLLFGFAVAGLLSVWVSPATVKRHLGKKGTGSIFKAAIFGIPLPLCSCGVIPVSASLRRSGASKGAVTSFLVATPQTGVDSILVTYSLLGGVYALFRPLFALVAGMLSGTLVDLFASKDSADEIQKIATDSEVVASSEGNWFLRALRYGFGELPSDIGRALLVGLLVAALISVFVPENYFSDKVPSGILQMLILMVAGIPVYVCATASVPLALALIHAGVSPGAAFAFLMTGPATNAATIAMIWKVMGRRTAILYLFSMAACALLGGLLLDQMVSSQDILGGISHGWMVPLWARHASAVALLLVLLWGVAGSRLMKRFAGNGEGNDRIQLRITGMTCSHCAKSVQEALEACRGVESAEVDLQGHKASVKGTPENLQQLCDAVQAIGYSAEVLE